MSDWDTVTVLRKRQPKASAMKTEGAINQVRKYFDKYEFRLIKKTDSNLNLTLNIMITYTVVVIFRCLLFYIRRAGKEWQLTHHKNVSIRRCVPKQHRNVFIELNRGAWNDFWDFC